MPCRGKPDGNRPGKPHQPGQLETVEAQGDARGGQERPLQLVEVVQNGVPEGSDVRLAGRESRHDNSSAWPIIAGAVYELAMMSAGITVLGVAILAAVLLQRMRASRQPEGQSDMG